jgi:Flp pilus assembly protein TadG
MLCMIICAVIGIGAYATDIAHNVTVRTQLQNAADAAAIAGAKDMVIPNQQQMADSDAEAVAAANLADGEPVSATTPGTEVDINASPTNDGGQCQVDAHKEIDNFFARIFGHNKSPIDVTATAIAYDTVSGVRQDSLFPLVASIDTPNGHAVPLYKSKIGDTVTFFIESQQYMNCGYTGFTGGASASYVNDAIDQILGLAPIEPGFVPALNIGDQMDLMNGVASTKDLSEEPYYSKLTDGRTLYIPVMSGDPPYNNHRPCLGFIGIKVTDVIKNQSHGKVLELVCTLTKGFVKGTPGEINGPASNPINNGIADLSPAIVQLKY